jgi:hypothetical protein
MVYQKVWQTPFVNNPTTGYGTLRMNGGAVARGTVSAAAVAAEDRDRHMVRLVMRESFLGGCELDVNLSAEEAANFASTLYALAKQAMIQNEPASSAAQTAAA